MDTIKIVEVIQHYIQDTNLDKDFSVRYLQEGYVEAISIIVYKSGTEIPLWDNQNGDRKWFKEINDYESFGVLIQRKIKEHMDDMKLLHNKMKIFNKIYGKTQPKFEKKVRSLGD